MMAYNDDARRPWDLDEALRRRLERRIYVPLPDAAARAAMFAAHLSSVPTAGEMRYGELAGMTEGLSGADVHVVCREASIMPVRRLLTGRSPAEIAAARAAPGGLGTPVVTFEDATAAARATSASVGSTARFEAWAREFGSS
jgi:katanin p60 ATPase-containing subunit A1